MISRLPAATSGDPCEQPLRFARAATPTLATKRRGSGPDDARAPRRFAPPGYARRPRRARGRTAALAGALRKPFRHLADDRDPVAWFHFCTGHHIEFLYWEATPLACERLISAAENGDKVAVARSLARAATLIRGSGAMLHYCAAFDPARYDPCLRPSMAASSERTSAATCRGTSSR